MKPTNVLHAFVVRCDGCGREAHIKSEGPPYFAEWKHFGDHGDNVEKWLIPTFGPSTDVLCGDCRAKAEGRSND